VGKVLKKTIYLIKYIVAVIYLFLLIPSVLKNVSDFFFFQIKKNLVSFKERFFFLWRNEIPTYLYSEYEYKFVHKWF